MIRVIGLGSPFGDDRVGWDLVEALRGRIPAGVDLLALDRPGAALVNWMEGVEWLTLVDAWLAPGELGRFRAVEPATLASADAPWNSHALDLHGAIALARILGLEPARLDIYGIAIGHPSGADRSPLVTAAVCRLAEHIAAALQQQIRGKIAAGAGRARTGRAEAMDEGGKNSLP